MRNLISFNSSFIWNDKSIDRNSCINSFNTFYLEAKKQDRFYIKQDLIAAAASIFQEINLYKSFDELKIIFPWLTSDSYNLLPTLLQIKTSAVISNDINKYDTGHEFNNSCWMGICEYAIGDYAYDLDSWKRIHLEFVMNYTRTQRLDYAKYFKEFGFGQLKIDPRIIKRKIKNGSYNHFERLDIPSETDGKTVHGQQIHIHLKNDGALNIDGTAKHQIKNIPNAAANHLVEIGFILPENL